MKSGSKRRMSVDLLDCRNKVKWFTGEEGYNYRHIGVMPRPF